MPVMSMEEFQAKYGGGAEGSAIPEALAPSVQGMVPTTEARMKTNAAQASAMAAPSRIMSPEEFDRMTAEAVDLPAWANGASPDSPLNTSPISVADRAALEVGNEAGKLAFLRKNYGNAKKDASGNFVVQDKNTQLWHRVDPEGLGDGDAWSKTRELVADASEWLPFATKTGAQVGVGALAASATGGLSLGAQAGISGAVAAALAAGETSLGRLVGTYEAEPEEQLRDIGIETVLNIGGTFIPAGGKASAAVLASGLKKGAEKLGLQGATKRVADVSKGAVTGTIATLTGAGETNMARLIERPTAVSEQLKKYLLQSGGKSEVAIQKIASDNLDDVRTLAEAVRPALSRMAGKGIQEAVENVPPSFSVNIKNLHGGIADRLKTMGVGYLDEDGMLRLYSKEQMREMGESAGQFAKLAMDDDSYKLVNKAVNELNFVKDFKTLQGPAGAKQILDFRQRYSDLSAKLQEVAKDEAMAPAQHVLAAVHDSIDNVITPAFDLSTPAVSSLTGKAESNLFTAYTSTYHESMRNVADILKAARRSAKGEGMVPYQTLLNRLQAKAGKNASQKDGFDMAIDLISQHGGMEGKSVAHLGDAIADRSAAAAFTPVVKPSLVSHGAVLGGAYALAAGSPYGALSAGLTAAATSPRMNYNMVKAALQGKALLAKNADALLTNTQAQQEWSKGMLMTPIVQQGIKQQLVDEGQQFIQGQGPRR
jgi:hypothetical protein